MERLMDIKSYFDTCNNFIFSEKYTWEGKILLNEDGFFEGIVNNYLSQNKDDYIFGLCDLDNYIEIIKVSKEDISESLIYTGKGYSNIYNGEIFISGLFGNVPCGVFKLNIKDSKLANKIHETNMLLDKIEKFKSNDDFKKIYNDLSNMKNHAYKILLSDYLNSIYFDEEENKENIKKIKRLERFNLFDNDDLML